MKSCGITGHREIEESRLEFIKNELTREIMEAINSGYTNFISGFAEGTDLIFASIISELKEDYPITLEAAIPYTRRMKTTDKEFQRLINFCDTIKIHSDKYFEACFMIRNRYIVRQSSRIIAVYDGRSRGGTLSTIRYAHSMERDVRLIYTH